MTKLAAGGSCFDFDRHIPTTIAADGFPDGCGDLQYGVVLGGTAPRVVVVAVTKHFFGVSPAAKQNRSVGNRKLPCHQVAGVAVVICPASCPKIDHKLCADRRDTAGAFYGFGATTGEPSKAK